MSRKRRRGTNDRRDGPRALEAMISCVLVVGVIASLLLEAVGLSLYYGRVRHRRHLLRRAARPLRARLSFPGQPLSRTLRRQRKRVKPSPSAWLYFILTPYVRAVLSLRYFRLPQKPSVPHRHALRPHSIDTKRASVGCPSVPVQEDTGVGCAGCASRVGLLLPSLRRRTYGRPPPRPGTWKRGGVIGVRLLTGEIPVRRLRARWERVKQQEADNRDMSMDTDRYRDWSTDAHTDSRKDNPSPGPAAPNPTSPTGHDSPRASPSRPSLRASRRRSPS